MAVEQDHLDRANLNLELAADLLRQFGKKYYPWVVTALFYAALHVVDARLARTNVHPGDHSGRKARMDANADFKRIRRPFLDLKNLSEEARYGPRGSPLPMKVFYKQELRESFEKVELLARRLGYYQALGSSALRRVREYTRGKR